MSVFHRLQQSFQLCGSWQNYGCFFKKGNGHAITYDHLTVHWAKGSCLDRIWRNRMASDWQRNHKGGYRKRKGRKGNKNSYFPIIDTWQGQSRRSKTVINSQYLKCTCLNYKAYSCTKYIWIIKNTATEEFQNFKADTEGTEIVKIFHSLAESSTQT